MYSELCIAIGKQETASAFKMGHCKGNAVLSLEMRKLVQEQFRNSKSHGEIAKLTQISVSNAILSILYGRLGLEDFSQTPARSVRDQGWDVFYS